MSSGGTRRGSAGAMPALPGSPRHEARREVSAFAYQLLSYSIVSEFQSIGDTRKLEEIGYQVGFRFAQRFVQSASRLGSTLDVIKLLCKELWPEMFGKQIEKLQTNHKGIYVLHDNNFLWVSNMNIDYKSTDEVEKAKRFLLVPCGLVRGALSNLGVDCTVRTEFSTCPRAFSIYK